MNFSRKSRSLFLFLSGLYLIICSSLSNVYGQIAVDSIRYNETDQSILLVYLNDVNVTYTPTFPFATPDWQVSHGPTPYANTYLMPRGPMDGNNVIRLRISSTVTYNESQEGISVQYFGTGPAITSPTQTLFAFGATPALNTLPFDCNLFKLDFGLNSATNGTCAPVDVDLDVTYNMKPQYQNSVNYDPNRIRIRIFWGDGSSDVALPAIADPGNPVLTENFTHIFPTGTTVCLYETTIQIGLTGIAWCSGGGLQQTVQYLNYDTDDEGSGILRMDIDTLRVCIGQDFSVNFTDDTYFNCNPAEEPTFPNKEERWIRFSYGTNYSGSVIQDILIDGMPQAFPYTGGLTMYDSVLMTAYPSYAQTLTISHAADLSTDTVGQIFELQMENWNPCNDIFVPDPPVITYSYIKIVDGPIADAGPDFAICEGDDADMDGQILRVATTGTWSTNTGDGSFADPTSPGGAVYTPGPNDISTGGVWLVLTAEAPASGCPGHEDSLYLTIDPLPAQPTLTVTGPVSFCYDMGATDVQLTASVSPSGLYEWYQNGAPSGLSTQTIVLDEPSESGTWTVRVFGATPNNCPSPWSAGQLIQIHALATTTNPADLADCELDDNLTFSVTTGGAAHTMRWQVRPPAGIWTDLSDNAIYHNTTTNTLEIDNVPYAYDNNEYRIRLTTVTGSCPTFSAPALLTVHPLPVITSQPTSHNACEGDNTSFSVAANIAEGNIDTYQWRRRVGSWQTIDGAMDGGIYTDFDTPTLLINPVTEVINGYQYSIRLYSDQGCRTTSSGAVLTVNLLADITVHPADADICVNTNTSFSVSTDGSPAVTIYQWQRSSGGPFVNIGAGTDGGIYTNWNQATLNLTAVPQTRDGYQYRCVLTTGGPCTITSNSSTLTIRPFANVTGDPTDLTICDGGNGSFSASATGSGLTYQWQENQGSGWNDLSNGGIYSNVTTPTMSLTGAPGTMSGWDYRCKFTVTGGCENFSLPADLSFHPDPAPLISGSISVCANDMGIAYSTPNVIGHSYFWTVTGGAIASGQNTASITVDWGAAGLGTVTVSETIDATGCNVTTAPYNVTINPGAPAAAGPITGVSPVCQGETGVGYSITPVAGADNYVWTVPLGGTIASGAGTSAITIDFAPTAADMIIQVYPENGCGAGLPASTFNITVNSAPAAFDQTPSECSDVIEANQATVDLTTLNDPVKGGPGPNSVTWFTDPGLSSPIGTPASYLVTDAVPVYARVWDGTCESSATVTYTVNSTPTANAQAPTAMCEDVYGGGTTAGIDLTALNNAVNGGIANRTVTWYTDAGLTIPVAVPGNTTVSDGQVLHARVQDDITLCINQTTASYTVNSQPEASNAGIAQQFCDNASTTMNANLASNGGTGTWTVVSAMIWNEDFDYPDGTTSAPGIWSVVNGGGGYADVRTYLFEAANIGSGNDAIWTSNPININGRTDVGISMQLASYGTGNGFENAGGSLDYIRVEYNVDAAGWNTLNNGDWTGSVGGLTGIPSNAYNALIATATLLNGNSLQIRISMRTTAADEIYQIDNILVSEGFGGTIPSIVTPNDAGTLINNLQYGVNSFMWTITHPTCPTTRSTVDVNRVYEPLANAGGGGSSCDYTNNLNGTASVPAAYRENYAAGWTQTAGPGAVTSWGAGQDQPATTVTVDTYGTYQFTWTETNGPGGLCTDDSTITLTFYRQPIANAGADGESCGPSYTLGAVPSIPLGDRVSYDGTWTMTAGPGTVVSWVPSANSPTATVTVDTYGDYEFTWTESNGGVCTDNMAINVSFYQQPLADAGSGGSECDYTFDLAATQSIPPANRDNYTAGWILKSGPGAVSSWGTGQNQPATTITVDTYGTYVFSWFESNGNGYCTDTADITVNFYLQPAANAGSGGDACALGFAVNAVPSIPPANQDGYTSQWTMTAGPGAVTSWGAGQDQASTTISVDTYGTYQFTWTESNGTGTCTDAGSITVNYYRQPVADAGSGGDECDLDFTLSATASVPLGDRDGYSAAWSYVGPGAVLSWSSGQTSPTTTVTVDTYGAYQFTWNESNGSGVCTDNEMITVTFYEQPTASAGAPSTDVCRDSLLLPIPLQGTIGGGATAGFWSVASGGGIIQNNNTVGTDVFAEYVPVYPDLGGNVILTLSTDNPAGPCDSAFSNIIIAIREAAYVGAGPDLAIAAGSSANLLGWFGGAATGITWSGGSGIFIPNENSPTATYTPSLAEELAGSVELVITTNDPPTVCSFVTDTMSIFIGENPTADAGPDFDICEVDSIPLIGVIGGSATLGTWSVIVGAGTVYDNVTGADDTVRAVYVSTPAERAIDVATGYIRVQLETDDPDGAGPVQPDSSRKDITIHPAPITPAIAGPTQACVNTVNMVYISNPLTPNSYYKWNVPLTLGIITSGGSGYNNNAVIMNAAAVAATDTIWVLETTQFGCVGDTVKKGLQLFDYPAQSPITGPNLVCAFDTAVTYSVPLNPGSTYQWFRPPGAFVNPPDTAALVKIDFGFSSGMVSVMETNPAGCVTNHIPLPVTVSPLPTANINASDVIICPGQPVTFTATPAGMANYDFFVDDTLSQSGIGATYLTDSLTDGQTVTVEVTNAGGCKDMSPGITVIVGALPDISLASSDADNIICFGESVTFIATSATGVSFEFFVDGFSVQNSPLTFFTTDTLHDGETVTVTTRDIVGCESTSPGITTTVNPLPVADLSGDAIICPTDVTNLAVNITTGLTPFTVEVDNGVGQIINYSNNDPIPVSPLATTVYNIVNVIDANGCRVDAPHTNLTGTATVTLNADISIITQPAAVTDCQGSDITFRVMATGTAPAYQWRKDGVGLVNGGNISGATTDELSITNIQLADAAMYDVVVSGTCLPATSAAVALTVQEDITVTGNPVDVIECPGGTIQFGATATGTNPVYRWRKNGTPLLDGGAISGTGTDTMTITGITVLDAASYDVIVTGSCLPDTSTAATLTLNIQPNITDQPDPVIECEGGLVTFIVDAGTTTNPTYEWQVDSLLSGFETISGVPYSGENTATLTINPIDSDMNGFRFRVLVGGTCSPSVYSAEVGLTVLEIPEITEHPQDSTICEDASVTFRVNPGVTAIPVYAWEVNDGGGWDPIAGAPYFGYNSAQLGILSAPSAMNGFQYRVTINGTCAPPFPSNIATLTINQKPEVGVHPADAVECETGLVSFTVDPGLTTNPTYQWQVDQGAGFNDVSGGVYTGENTTTLTVDPITSPMSGYRYRAIINGTCAPPAQSNPASLTVDENPEIVVEPTDETICELDDVFFFVNPGVTTDPTFVWEYNTGAGWNPVPSDAFHSGINNDTLFLTAAPSTMHTWQYRVVVDGKCNAPVTSLEVTLTVNQRPEIILHPADSTICEDADATFTVDAGVTTGATYQWQVSTGGAFGNIFGGIYTGENTPVLTVSSVPSSYDGFLYRVLVGGTCTPNVISDTAVLTVLQKPEILSQPIDVTICEDDNAEFGINSGLTTAPIYQWQVDDGMGGGFADILAGPIYSGFDSDTLRIAGGLSSMDGYRYRVVVYGDCTPNDTSDVVTLTVYEKPEILSQPADSTICEYDNATFGVFAGATTTPFYQWQVDNGMGGGFVNAFGPFYIGQNTDTLMVNNAPSSMNGYRFRVVITGACTPADTSAIVTLTVHDRPEILVQPSSPVICEDGSTLIGIDAGETTGATFQWQVDDHIGPPGFTDISGAPYTGFNTDTLFINPATSIMNGYSYQVILSGACAPTLTSNAVDLTVNEKPEVIVHPVDSTVCEGAQAAFSVNAGFTTMAAYEWLVDEGTGFNTISGGPYFGENTANLMVTSTDSSMNGYLYRVVVSGICTPNDTSNFAALTVLDRPEILSNPVDTTECEDGLVTFGIDPGKTTSPTFRWQVDEGSGFGNIAGGDYAGFNTDTLTAFNINTSMHGYRYRVIVSGTCTPDATSGFASLFINEKPEVSRNPVDITVCELDGASFDVAPGVTTNPEYRWQYDLGGPWTDVPAGPIYEGVDSNILVITATDVSMNGIRYRAVISGECTPDATSLDALLTVHERPEINLQPVDETICEDDNISFTVNAGPTTAPTYRWQVSTGAGFNNVGGAVYSGETTATLTITGAPSSMNGYQYRVIVGGSCTPQVISDTVILTVNEKPEVMIHPEDADECEDGTVIFVVNPGVTTVPTYQWQESTGGAFANLAEGIPYVGVNNDTLMISGITSLMHTNRYRVVISGTCTPIATSNDAGLTVYEKPEISIQPTDETICEDDNISFSVNAGVTTNPTYQWQVDQNSGSFVNVSGGFYSGQNSATLNITGALAYMNGYKYRVIVGGYCAPADTSIEVTLTILNKPEVIGHPSNSLICEGLETYFTVDAGVTTLPTYEWQVDVNGSGTFVAVSGAPYQGENTDSLIITTPTSAMNGYIYRARISGSCTPDAFSNNAILFVRENPEVALHPVDSIICENENAAFTVDAGVTTSPDYQWQVNDGGMWVNLTDAGKYVGSRTSTLNIFNGTADMDGYRYQVIISGTCAPPATSNPATLTVNLRPVITSQPVNSTICAGAVTTFNVAATGFALTYQWQVDDGSGYAPVIDGGVYSGAGTPTLTVSGPDATYDGFRYRVIVDNYCGPQQSSNIATLTVNTPPSVVTNPVDVAICEFTNTTFQVNAQGGGISYQWQENDGSGWVDIPEAGNYVGTKSPSLSLFTVDSAMTGFHYRAVITGVCAPPATSAAATLTVYTSPQITVHPADRAVCETVNAQFSLTAIGDGLMYRWQENNGGGFADIPEGGFYSGTGTATLTINAPIVGMNGNTYRVIVSGTCVPPRTSNFAMLTVNTFPSMITQPVSDEICEGGNVTFIAAASGTGISYQWQENSGSGWTDIMDGGIYSGATTPTFTLTSVPVTYNGYRYRLNVIGTCAPLPSAAADLIVNAIPDANITGDGNFPVVCGGLPMILNGNPSGGSGTWASHVWSGDIFGIDPVDAQTTVFQTQAHGSYNLTYTVTDSKGCIAKDQVIIENDRPDARFTSNARPSCGTLTVNFTNESNRAVVYEWDFDDPLNPGTVTDENPSYDFSNFSTTVQYFNVEMVAFSINGCTDTAKEVITIYPSIDASFTVDPPDGCNPVTVEMVSTPGGSNYYWDFGDGNAKNGSHHEIHQFVNTGTDPVTYTVSLTTTSFYGCFDTKTMPVTVYPIPQVNFTADPIIQEFPSATVDFNNLTPEGSWAFTWDFDDGNTSNEVSPTHTYSGPGNYSVVLRASTAQCEDSIVHLITIEPAAPVADFVQPAPGCAPLEITFQNNSQFATSYVWDFGNGSTSFKENPTFTYYESGTYAVTLTVFGPGGTDAATKLVQVKITPVAYTTVAPTYVFVNDVPVKCFNLTTDTSNCTYLWEFGDGESSNVFEPAHVYKEPGRYDITLTATNDNECSSSYVFSYIEVEPAGELLFPNVFKPNPDGASGGRYVQGQDNNQIFFPGVYDQVIQYELVIYNRWGELIFISNDVNIGWDGYIDGKMMAQQGVYVWKVTGKYANGKSFVHVGDITLLR